MNFKKDYNIYETSDKSFEIIKLYPGNFYIKVNKTNIENNFDNYFNLEKDPLTFKTNKEVIYHLEQFSNYYNYNLKITPLVHIETKWTGGYINLQRIHNQWSIYILTDDIDEKEYKRELSDIYDLNDKYMGVIFPTRKQAVDSLSKDVKTNHKSLKQFIKQFQYSSYS